MKILNLRQARKIEEMAVTELAKYIKSFGLKTIVLGISGGLDSAVMAAIGLKVISKLGKEGYLLNYIYKFIDVESKEDDLKKARVLGHELGFDLTETNLTGWYHAYPGMITDAIAHEDRVSNGNVKCRIRMIDLYREAGNAYGLVLDTDDLSEFYMGFWTRHGDEGDVKLLQELTKDEIRDLGEFLGIPNLILSSAPGDGLGVTNGNMASDQLKMEYLKIDFAISRLLQYGFDCNGSRSQLKVTKYVLLIADIAKEIDEPCENVQHIASQALRTTHKRKYGHNVANLLSSRGDMGLPEIGTGDFNRLYFDAIKKTK